MIPARLLAGILLSSGVAAANALTTVITADQDRRPLRASFIDSVFADYAKPGAPGVAVLVAHGDSLIVRKGYGMADLDKPAVVVPATAFQLASLSKPFTAIATLMLIRDGRLALEETIADVFPDFATYGRRITIRHLLSHTDGLLDGRLLPEARSGESGILARLQRADSVLFMPGQQFRYGNAGYAVLAEIIAKRSGMRFGTFLQRRVFGPLGMKSTFVCGELEPTPHLRANGYTKVDSAWKRVGIFCDPSAWNGAGGVVSSVDDLIKFQQALTSARLLPNAVLADAFAPYTLNDGSKAPVGYGWMIRSIDGRRSLLHFGSMPGFRTYLTHYPDHNLTIIVLANRDPENDTQLPGPVSLRIADRFFSDIKPPRQ